MSELSLHPLMFPYLVALFFLFGSLLGSFCNVVILRMAEGRSIVFPPSSCPACRHQLSPLDLIPIVGWILLRGRCRYCGVPISGQYPLVETVVALNMALAFMAFGFSGAFLASATWGTFWIIVSVLWIRAEVRVPAPFLWPFLFWGPLWWVAGRPLPELASLGLAVCGAAVGALLLGWRDGTIDRGPLFGVSAVALAGIRALGWAPLVGYGALLAIMALDRPGEPGMAR